MTKKLFTLVGGASLAFLLLSLVNETLHRVPISIAVTMAICGFFGPIFIKGEDPKIFMLIGAICGGVVLAFVYPFPIGLSFSEPFYSLLACYFAAYLFSYSLFFLISHSQYVSAKGKHG